MAKSTKVTSQKKSNEFDFSKISTLIDNITKKDIISIEDFEKEKTNIDKQFRDLSMEGFRVLSLEPHEA